MHVELLNFSSDLIQLPEIFILAQTWRFDSAYNFGKHSTAAADITDQWNQSTFTQINPPSIGWAVSTETCWKLFHRERDLDTKSIGRWQRWDKWLLRDLMFNNWKINAENEKENDSRGGQTTQAMIQRRRRPKRRSTGVVHVDMEVKHQKLFNSTN